MHQQRVLQRRRGGAHGTSVLLLVAALAACNGKIGANGGSGQVPVGATVYGPTGLHRLSRIEYDNTLADLLGDNSRSGFAALPEDVNDPFDNDFSTQVVSGALIGSAETLAAGAATRLLADTAKRNALVGCTPVYPCTSPHAARLPRSFFERDLGSSVILRRAPVAFA